MISELKQILNTRILGKVIHYEEELGSTNSKLLQLGEKGVVEGAVVIADKQTAGKGRLGRKWISPPGENLYISILFRPRILTADSPIFTLLASVALVEAIEKAGVTGAKVRWPNDIQIEGKKVSGVLTELRSKGDMVDFIVVGIGVNINMSREEMDSEMGEVSQIATSIKEKLGRDVDRAQFTAGLLLELERYYQIFSGDGKAPILEDWTSRWGDLNKRVMVSVHGEEKIEGTATGIDDSGYLHVKTDDGETVPIIAGDVRII